MTLVVVRRYSMKYLNKIEEIIIVVGLFMATSLLFINIVLRYGFASNTTWAEEFIRYVMIWITFIGGSVCFRKGLHVGVDFLVDLLKGRAKRGLHLFVNVASMIFMVFLIKYSLDLVVFTMQTGQITPSLQIPLYVVYLAIPIGSTLSFIHLILQTTKMIRNKDDSSKAETI